MSTKSRPPVARRATSARPRPGRARWTPPGGRRVVWISAAVIAGLGVLYGVFQLGSHSANSGPSYAVGSPGPGAAAPAIQLPATTGANFDLAAQRGKTVLLFFQEGIDCEPCWTQLKDLQAQTAQLHGLGVDEVVSVTTDPLYALRQKTSDEGITVPVLSDPSLSVSRSYQANNFGMMGTGADGHTMIVVGPNGAIRWRADYGGAPNYTMFVPMNALLRQMRAGMTR